MTCHNCGSDQHLIRECDQPPPPQALLAPGRLGLAPLAPGQTSLVEAARHHQPVPGSWLDRHRQEHEQGETGGDSSPDEHEQLFNSAIG
eukprot:2199546-Heterocapsa_arctica.AAC.1